MTAITDLIEDWIQMRSTLQRQLKMLESSEMYAGDKISDSTIGDTIVRVRRCIDELNSLLKEYAISPRRCKGERRPPRNDHGDRSRHCVLLSRFRGFRAPPFGD